MSSEPPPFPPPPPDPNRVPRPWDGLAARLSGSLRGGWGWAALGALGVLLVLFVLNVLVAILQQETFSSLVPAGAADVETLGQVGIVKSSMYGLFLWHGVSMNLEFAVPPSDLPLPISFEASASVPFLAGTALAVWMLYRVGRLVAARSGSAGWFSALDGLKVALPYTLAAFVLAIFTRDEVTVSADAPEASIAVSLGGAFFLPLLLSLGAATAGALSGRPGPASMPGRLALAAVAAGWRMTWLSVALATFGFLIVAALHPEETRAYLDVLPGDGLGVSLLVVVTLLLLPNAGAGIAAASMGGSINYASLGDSCALVSYVSFPNGLGGPGGVGSGSCAVLEQGVAPLPYFLFLLVPAVATVAGGWLAAQRTFARNGTAGAQAGVLAAVPFAFTALLLAVFVRIGYDVGAGPFPFDLGAEVGPGIISTFLLALAWGALGGSLGGALAGARNGNGPGEDPPGPLEAPRR